MIVYSPLSSPLKSVFDPSMFQNLVVATPTFELREDGSFELREDGSKELRG